MDVFAAIRSRYDECGVPAHSTRADVDRREWRFGSRAIVEDAARAISDDWTAVRRRAADDAHRLRAASAAPAHARIGGEMGADAAHVRVRGSAVLDGDRVGA